jgi:hypothetical protein
MMAEYTFVVGCRKPGGFVLQARGKKQKIDVENYPRVMKEAPENGPFRAGKARKIGSIFLLASRSEGGIFLGIKKARPILFTTEREGWESVPPEVLEPRRTQRRVSGGMCD